MKYKKGDIFEYEFDSKDGSKVIDGKHRAIVLHSRKTPYKTILIAPITTLESLAKDNKVPANYLKLESSNYPIVLDHDSYVNLDMIMTIDGDDLVIFERKGIPIKAQLNEDDMNDLDFKLALTYELQDFVKEQVNEEVNIEVKNIVEYIDTDIRKKVEDLIKVLSDKEVIKSLKDLINIDLIQAIKDTYSI